MAIRVCVGQFAAAHGVRGGVKLRSFTADPEAVVGYGPLTDETGTRSFSVSLTGTAKDAFLVRVAGITTRDAAEALNGVKLFVDRDRLPATEEDEYYHADLIGLRAVRVDGIELGTVRAVHDFGAGNVLEIARDDGRAELVPFTRAVVPVVDIAGRRVMIDPPFAVDPAPETEPPEEP